MASYERYWGGDYGLARVGVAISDPLGIRATGLETIHWDGKRDQKVLDRLTTLAREYDVSSIVMGLPKRTDNAEEGQSAQMVRAFAAKLEEALKEAGKPVPIVFVDERLTTVQAGRILRESTVKKGRYRQVVDQVAAELILQSFLEKKRWSDRATDE